MREIKCKALSAVIATVTLIAAIPFSTVSAEATGVRGDANQNGKTDVRDCAYIATTLAKGQGDTLPEEADYNLDGKRNVSDAANLARDAAKGAIKTYDSVDSPAIIDGLKIGMTMDEVFAVIGEDYVRSHENVLYATENISYIYNIDRIDKLDVDIPSVMFVSFSEGILYNFGYHIGRTDNSSGVDSYTDDIDELVTAFDKIHDVLTDYYGKAVDTENITARGVIKESTWDNTDYGEVWMIVGKDLWMEGSGTNEITLSSCDQSLAGDYAD